MNLLDNNIAWNGKAKLCVQDLVCRATLNIPESILNTLGYHGVYLPDITNVLQKCAEIYPSCKRDVRSKLEKYCVEGASLCGKMEFAIEVTYNLKLVTLTIHSLSIGKSSDPRKAA